jgi:hypothetical protein
MSETLRTYEIYIRESATSLKIERHTHQAATIKEAREFFEQTYGSGRTVAGPSLVKIQD